MVKKRMAMRMVTIFVALIVCGMFFPGLARGEDLSIDQGLDVDFEDVVIGEEKTIPLQITSQSDHTLTLIPTFAEDAYCDFTYFKIVDEEPTQFGVTYLDPGEVLNLKVTFSASDVGLCTAWLDIMYTGSPGGAVRIDFTANGVEEVLDSFGSVVIGNSTTHVQDRMIDEHTSSTLQQMIDDCEYDRDEFKNHGAWVWCIRSKTRDLMEEGYLTGRERGELVSAAARAQMQSVIEKWKERRNRLKSSRGHHKYWWVCSGE
jgi:hypothetical protein